MKTSHKTPPTPPQKKFDAKAKSEILTKVYEDWKKNKSLNMVSICDKHKITEDSLRAWLYRRGLKRPDGIDKSVPSERYDWIAKGYARGLELGLTARQASVWASEKSKTHIQRGDIQHYAAKFDLPLLTETDNGSFIGRNSKYA